MEAYGLLFGRGLPTAGEEIGDGVGCGEVVEQSRVAGCPAVLLPLACEMKKKKMGFCSLFIVGKLLLMFLDTLAEFAVF